MDIDRITAVFVNEDATRLAYVLDDGNAGIYVVNTDMITSEGHEVTEADLLDRTWRQLT